MRAQRLQQLTPPRRRKSDAEEMIHEIFRNSRRLRSTILPLIAVVLSLALCLPVLLISNINIQSNISQISHSIGQLGSNIGSVPSIAITLPQPFVRPRSRTLTDEDFKVPEFEGEDDPTLIASPPSITKSDPPGPLPSYSLGNVLQTLPHFHDTLAIVIYDPSTDKFIAHYSNEMRWISGCHKLISSFKVLANTLRVLFPTRFTTQSPEFALAISSADYPGIKWTECLRHQRTDCIPEDVQLSPILQFGSTFRRPLFPTMIPMPMPQMNHINCFHYWGLHHQICEYYLPRGPGNPNGLVFGETIGLTRLEDLIPQIVWRGTDFSFLHKMNPSLRSPNFEMDIASQIDLSERVDKKTAATNAMKVIYDELIPRWKGVVWTAEAERDADAVNLSIVNRQKRKNRKAQVAIRRNKRQARKPANQAERRQEQQDRTEKVGTPAVPWVNIKFAGAMYRGKKTPTSEIEYYQQFEEFGIPVAGEGMSLETLGQYKYHIDLGGGGGTTWSGTLEKLGLPGLLFHHVTPTYDYLHTKMEPWVHYVPVKSDLSDLREKYDWAESHPKMAQQISDNASRLAASFGTPEGMEILFQQFFEWPLSRIVESYVPLEEGVQWRDVLAELGYGEEVLRPIMACGGYYKNDCEKLVNDIHYNRLHDRDLDTSERERRKKK